MRRLTKHIFPKSNRRKKKRKELDEASRLVQLQYRQGALYFDISRPTKKDNYIRAQVHRYTSGEDGSQVQDVSDGEKGFVSAEHASFGQALLEEVLFKSSAGRPIDEKPEARVFTEIKSDSRYLNLHCGTITVEGFSRECWNYEQLVRNTFNTELTNNECKHKFVFARLQQRMIELEKKDLRKIGLDRAADDKEVMEFVGNLGCDEEERQWRAAQPVLVDSRTIPSAISQRLVDGHQQTASLSAGGLYRKWMGIKSQTGASWILLRIDLGQGTAAPIEVDNGWYPEFTNGLWAQLIVADQWFPNTPANDEERGLVEMMRRAGDSTLEAGRYNEAIELYSMAIGMDPTNATTRCQKIRALLAKGIYSTAVKEASVAVRVAPTSMWAWHYLGLAYLQAECFTRADISFAKALALVESGKVPSGQYEALTKTQEEIASEKAPFENKQPELCWMGVSTISQQQIEGIIRFAEEMQWPYLNEVREHAPRVCNDVSTGQCWIAVLHNWFCGLSLPGARFAHNIMPALISCSPSRPDALEYYCQFESGTAGVSFRINRTGEFDQFWDESLAASLESLP
ncbi:hypothetical protein BJX65DRAFT_311080 [Aspergillus insuetus]